MSSIESICEEHRAIEAFAAKLLRATESVVPDPASVAALRWGMAQALVEHCVREEREVYAWLLASGDPAAAAVAQRFTEQHGALARRFTEYVSGWPIARLGREWEAFRAETAVLVRDLARRIAAEEAELHPHFERVAGLRAAA